MCHKANKRYIYLSIYLSIFRYSGDFTSLQHDENTGGMLTLDKKADNLDLNPRNWMRQFVESKNETEEMERKIKALAELERREVRRRMAGVEKQQQQQKQQQQVWGPVVEGMAGEQAEGRQERLVWEGGQRHRRGEEAGRAAQQLQEAAAAAAVVRRRERTGQERQAATRPWSCVEPDVRELRQLGLEVGNHISDLGQFCSRQLRNGCRTKPTKDFYWLSISHVRISLVTYKNACFNFFLSE